MSLSRSLVVIHSSLGSKEMMPQNVDMLKKTGYHYMRFLIKISGSKKWSLS